MRVAVAEFRIDANIARPAPLPPGKGLAQMDLDLGHLLRDQQGSLVLEGFPPPRLLPKPAAPRRLRADGDELRQIREHVLARIAPDQDNPAPAILSSLTAPALPAEWPKAEYTSPAAAIPRSRAKRVLDVVGAAGLLFLLLPLLFFVGIFVALDGHGPVLFLQRRCGMGGSVFRIFKFRTMITCDDGDTVAQTARDDRRITRFGAFLRRTSIDELPQLFNVLTGEMSLVGPRPHAAAHDRTFAQTLPHYAGRYLVRPGITGLAQVRGQRGAIHDPEQLAGRVASDLEYIEKWSIFTDLRILAASVGVVFRPTGG